MRSLLARVGTCLAVVAVTAGCASGRSLPPPAALDSAPTSTTPATAGPLATSAAPSTVTPQSTASSPPPARTTTSASIPPPPVDLSVKVAPPCTVDSAGPGLPTMVMITYQQTVNWTPHPLPMPIRTFFLLEEGPGGVHREREFTAVSWSVLGPGRTVEANIFIGQEQIGRTFSLRAVVDPDNQIAETSERDNTVRLLVTIPADAAERMASSMDPLTIPCEVA